MEKDLELVTPDEMRNFVLENGFKPFFESMRDGEIDYTSQDVKLDFCYVVACLTLFDTAEFVNEITVDEDEDIARVRSLFQAVLQQIILDMNLLFDTNISMLEKKEDLTEDEWNEHKLIKQDFIRGTAIIAERTLEIINVMLNNEMTYDIVISILNDVAEFYLVGTELGLIEEDSKEEGSE